MRKLSKTAASLLIVSLILGCEGDAGRPGISLIGDDIFPPLVELILPFAMHTAYERVVFEAFVRDDGEIDRVEFIVDGWDDPAQNPAVVRPPFQVLYDCSGMTLGRHFVQAAAFDKKGRRGLSKRAMFYKDTFPESHVRDTLAFFDQGSSGDEIWVLPDDRLVADSLKYTGYGVRVTMDSPGVLNRLWVNLYRDTSWTGTQVSVEIRSSSAGLPDSLINSFEIDGTRIRMLPNELFTHWQIVKPAAGDTVRLPYEYFILATLSPEASGDSLGILSDDGFFHNMHSVVRMNDRWQSFSIDDALMYNPMIKVAVVYE